MSISWSIDNKLNPSKSSANPHFITTIGLCIMDLIYRIIINIMNYIYSFIMLMLGLGTNNSLISKPSIHNKYPFSKDLNELMDKGIFRFILDRVENSKNSKYITFDLCNVPVFMPIDTGIARTILYSEHAKRGRAYDKLTEFFGYGIFTSRIYDRWKNQKNITVTLLHGKTLKSISNEMYDNFVIDITKYYNKSGGAPVDLVLMLSQIGLFAFCDSALGVDVRDIADELPPRINRMLAYINGGLEPFSIPFTEAYNNSKSDSKFIHEWMLTVVERMKNNINVNDNFQTNIFIDEIMKIDKKQQVELMISMVLGGHETTARLALGALYEIIKNKKYITRIREEIQNYKSENNKTITYDSIFSSGKFKYLHMIIQESLRLYPPVWLLSRSLTNNLDVGDNIIIKKDTMILLSPLIMQRQTSLWGDNAEVFYPERFSEKLPDFFPFIVGKEKCPADKFAVMEAMMMIIAFFDNFDMELVDENQLPDPTSAGTFRLFTKLNVILTKRQNLFIDSGIQ